MKRCILHISLFLYTLVMSTFHVTAENSNSYTSYILGTTEGLSSQIAFNIVKADDGFVWIANTQGVDMYNGISFKHYNLFPNDIRTVHDGQKISLYRGSEGKLWAFTDSGHIYYYNLNSDSFELFMRLADQVPYCLLNSLLQVGDKLYLGINNGIKCINISQKELLHSELSDTPVNILIPYKNSMLLAGTQKGVYILDSNQHIIEHFTSTSTIDVQELYWEQSKDEIWIGSNGQGAWRMSEKRLSQINLPQFSSATIRAIRQLDKQHLLLGSDGMGIFCINIDETMPELFATDISLRNPQLPSSSVYDIMVDNDNIWVATYRGGITLLRKNNAIHQLENKNREVNNENIVNGICEDREGKIWVAFNSSIGCFDLETNNFKSYLNRASGFLTLNIDDNGYLWCGGYNSGVHRMNIKTGVVEHYKSMDGNLENDHVYTIYKDETGDIWIGGLNFRLTRISVDGNGFHIKQHYDIKQVRTLCSMSKDSLLVGTSAGFHILNTKNGKIDSYLQSFENMDWVGSNFINCMAYNNDSELWFGTAGGGLLYYNLKTNQIIPYTTQDGLPSNYIAGMQLDNQNQLWISTETCGIFVFNCQEKKFVAGIKRYEGLFFNDFLPNSSCRLSDGQLVFGGYNGAIVLQPEMTLPQSKSPSICFTDLTIQKEKITYSTHPTVLQTSLNQMTKMTLPFNFKTFALDVCTSNLYNQSSYQLYYRLEGYETEWKSLGQQHKIMYADLPPGKYTLQIRNSNSTLPDYAQREVTIVVEQTFWLQWYTFIGYIMILLCLTYWALVTYKNYMNNKLSKEKIHFFTNVAHDIRTPLSLVAAPLESLNKLIDKSDQEKYYLLNTAMKSVQHMQNMVNQLLDFNKLGMSEELLHWSIIDLKVELSIINDVYLPLAEAKGLSFNIHYPAKECYIYSDEALFHRILDNLLSNALKYTSKGSVDVIASIKGKNIQIEVKDTGIGISHKSGGRLFHQFFRGENAINEKIAGYGIGLFFTHKLVRLLKGKLSFKSKLNSGTSFYLCLPMAEAKSSYAPATQEATNTPAPNNRHSIHKENILLIEDNSELRQYLAYALAKFYNVSTASSAEEALQKLSSLTTELIISDIILPGMSGIELCKHLKQQIEMSHIPIILLTGSADKEIINKGLAAGADGYMTKPFELDILLLKIQNIFHARKKLHAYYLSKIQIESTKKPNTPEDSAKESMINQSSVDDVFLQKLTKLIIENLSNSEFAVKDICNEMAMSRTLLYEKIRKLLGMAPNDLIRDIRMKQAKAWLEEGNCSVTSIAFKCGYPDARYFSTAFKNFFGVSPSTLIPKNQSDTK